MLWTPISKYNMKKKISSAAPEDNDSIAEHILSSLKYLHSNCPSAEFRPIFKISFDLCRSVIRINSGEHNSDGTSSNDLDAKNFIASLEYLRKEAARNGLGEIKTILDATFMLCLAVYCLQLKEKYNPADFLSIG